MATTIFTAASLVFGAAILATPANALGISFSWGPTKQCSDSKSPPIKVSGVPAGTEKLRFRMIDLDATDYPHGGGSVAYSGQNSLPYGAFRYSGPCPPTPHTYQITVEALDAGGKVLAFAKARKRFP